MAIRRGGRAAALVAALLLGGLLLAPARADEPGDWQQQMQTMRQQMMGMQQQMLWMQQMMGRAGMMGPGGYGMMGPGSGYGMMDPDDMPGYGMMGQGGPGYGMMGQGAPGYGMMGQGAPGYGMMGQGGYGMMGAAGGDADRNFVLMIQRHHQGEIAMAAAVAAETKDPDIKKLAEMIQADHEKDLQALQDWLDKHQ